MKKRLLCAAGVLLAAALAIIIKAAVGPSPRQVMSAEEQKLSEWFRELIKTDDKFGGVWLAWRNDVSGDTKVPYQAILYLPDISGATLSGMTAYGTASTNLGAALKSLEEHWKLKNMQFVKGSTLAGAYENSRDLPAEDVGWVYLGYVSAAGTVEPGEAGGGEVGIATAALASCCDGPVVSYRDCVGPILPEAGAQPTGFLGVGYDGASGLFATDPCLPDPDPQCHSTDPCIAVSGEWPDCVETPIPGCCHADPVMVIYGTSTWSGTGVSWFDGENRVGYGDEQDHPTHSESESQWDDSSCCPDCGAGCHGGTAWGEADAWVETEIQNQCVYEHYAARVDQEYPCDHTLCCICDVPHACCPFVGPTVRCGMYQFDPIAQANSVAVYDLQIIGFYGGLLQIEIDKTNCINCPSIPFTGIQACVYLQRVGNSGVVDAWTASGTYTVPVSPGAYYLVVQGDAYAVSGDPCPLPGNPANPHDACNGQLNVDFSFTPNANPECTGDADPCTRAGCVSHACTQLDDPCCGDPCPPEDCCDDDNPCTRDCPIDEVQCASDTLAQSCDLAPADQSLSCGGDLITLEVEICNPSGCGEQYTLSASKVYGEVPVYQITVIPGVVSVGGNSCATFEVQIDTGGANADDVLGIEVTAESEGEDICGPVTYDGCRSIIEFEAGPPVDLTFDSVPTEREENPGGFLCVNNDDDNANGVADKDDDGPTAGEDDLVPLTVTADGTLVGTLTLSLTAGQNLVKVYENPDRSDPVTLPQSWPLGGLPKTFTWTYYVEGVAPSVTARDVGILLEYVGTDGPCEDEVKVSVGGVEFLGDEFTGEVHRNVDLLDLVNPTPVVQLYSTAIPSTGAPVLVTVTGDVTSFVAPLPASEVTINGQEVSSLQLQSSGPNGLGPFVQTFSQDISLPDHDLLMRARATNALQNTGEDKRVIIAEFDCNPPLGCPGTFESRTARDEPSIPTAGAEPESFAISVIDPFATDDSITIQVDTGVEIRSVELQRVGGSIEFKKEGLQLAPENLSLPAGTPQDVADTRFRGRLGIPVRATHAIEGVVCEDNALTVGMMFVDAATGQPVTQALAGLPKDVENGGIDRQPLLMVTGLPGDSTAVTQDMGNHKLVSQLVARDYRDDPDPGAPGSTTFVDLLRQSDSPGSSGFNLFKSDPATPLLPLCSEEALAPPNPNLTVRNVHSGGFLRLAQEYELGTLEAVEPIQGPIIVNVLVDGLGAGFPQASFAPAMPSNLETILAAGFLPNFAKLIGDSAHSVKRFDANTTFPSITFSAWSSWVTGKPPGVHGVTGSNFFRRDAAGDPFWSGSGEMWTPVDHVSFHGPAYPIADNDIENVWATFGTLNSAIRPTVSTVYELLAVKGIRSGVVYHFPYRGVGPLERSFPTAFGGLIDHSDSTGTALDDGTTFELKELMDPPAPLHIRPPQVLTVYYAGLDTNVHNNPAYPGVGAVHLIRTDRYLATLVRLLEQWNLMDEAMFTFTGDHGLTDVYKDDTHSLLIESTGDEELEDVFNHAGYDVLDNADPIFEGDYDSVITVNGGMAHVYVRNRTTNLWPDPPNYALDVLPLAERFYDNAVGVVVDDLDLPGSIELVLVRDAIGPNWNAPYRVLYRAALTSGDFQTLPLTDALSFTHPTNGLPLVPPGYVEPVTNLQRLQDKRSGDIILLSNYSKKHRNAIAPAEEGDPNGLDGGYYFGGELDCWHGSLYDTDMTIPIVFSFPRGNGVNLEAFLAAVNASFPAPPEAPMITDIARTVYLLHTGEGLP